MSIELAKVLELPTTEHFEFAAPMRVQLVALLDNGELRVRAASGSEFLCAWLETGVNATVDLSVGDWLLMLPPVGQQFGVVLGRIGLYKAPQSVALQSHVSIEATEGLSLKCGNASIDLRADGQVLIKGEDVTLRAKGTQTIRAGNVSIN